MNKILKALDYECDIASNGLEGVRKVEKSFQEGQRYSLILMDIQMPIMDGISATQHILEKFGQDSPKIVAVTANTLRKNEDECLNAGMDGFIRKPVDKEVVSKILEDTPVLSTVWQDKKRA